MDNTKLKSRMSGKVQELQQPGEAAVAPCQRHLKMSIFAGMECRF